MAAFFAMGEGKEVGLGVFIIKARAVADGSVENILAAIRAEPGFVVLREKRFTPEEVRHVSNELRGGVWHDAKSPAGDLLPAVALLVLDETVIKKAKAGTSHAVFDQRIRDLKKRLRKMFDHAPGSAIHATDNTTETWEYVTHCFPNERESIDAEIAGALDRVSLTLVERITFWSVHMPRLLTYTWMRAKRRLKEGLLSAIVR